MAAHQLSPGSQMAEIQLRPMARSDWEQVSELIYLGTNRWYESHGMGPIFTSDPISAQLFCEVYEALDPGCCILAVESNTKQIVGSCFYHPRDSHVSLGIMNVHPEHFGKGIASRLLKYVIDFADGQRKPIRLVSSALNLDSYSLYTRYGFVPRMAFQDMILTVPESGLDNAVPESARVREATIDDVPAIMSLEQEVNHISREQDYRHFIEDEAGIWHMSVLENETGELDGFLVSIQHDASNMLGPGIAKTAVHAAALIHAELNQHPGRSPVFLVPVECQELVQTLYCWGARNCEIHFAQIRGEFTPPTGIVMPTFMPETG